jgi:hypothetical protein
VNRQELIDHWRAVEQRNAPLRVEGRGDTPRHRLVEQARLRLRVLDPEVKVWVRQLRRLESGLVVAELVRHRLG